MESGDKPAFPVWFWPEWIVGVLAAGLMAGLFFGLAMLGFRFLDWYRGY